MTLPPGPNIIQLLHS